MKRILIVVELQVTDDFELVYPSLYSNNKRLVGHVLNSIEPEKSGKEQQMEGIIVENLVIAINRQDKKDKKTIIAEEI